MAQALDQALLALRAGQPAQAQAFIAQVLRTDPRNIDAWLLLEQCVEPTDRRKYCLQQVLLLSPDNQTARQRLAALELAQAPVAQKPEPPAAPVAVQVNEAPPALPQQSPAASGGTQPDVSEEPNHGPELAALQIADSMPASNVLETASTEPDYDLLRSASAPSPSGMESALIDEESFQPGPFAVESASISGDAFDDNQMAAIPESPAFSTITPESPAEAEVAAPDTSSAVTLPGIARNIDKNAIRARLEQAVSNIEGGRKAEGIAQLEEIVTLDPRNEMAWMWLGAAAEDDVRKRECYRQALAVNPRSKMARDYLQAVEARIGPASAADNGSDGTKSGGPSLIVWALIAILVVIIGIVVFFALRRFYIG